MRRIQGKFLLVAGVLLGSAVGCLGLLPPASPTPDLAAVVQATVSALGLSTQAEAPVSPTPTRTPAPSSTGVALPEVTITPVVVGQGSISGHLSYPSEAIPAERVVAFSTGSPAYFFVDTAANSATYKIPNLPAGTYHVVAYVAPSAPAGFPIGLAAGYSQAVLCGLVYGCNDHSLLAVVVSTGSDTPQINPQDWYAPAGSFPPMPTP
ncbi:MAG: hypothetical protein ABSF61_06135 [Anaerolineales bacterium]|jgi:hypothetical protein